jgi:hypothetical protein
MKQGLMLVSMVLVALLSSVAMAQVDAEAVALQAERAGSTWEVNWAIGLKVPASQGSFELAVQIRHYRNGALVSVLQAINGNVTQGTPSCGPCQSPSSCGNSCSLGYMSRYLSGYCTDPQVCPPPGGGVLCWCEVNDFGKIVGLLLQVNDVIELSAWPGAGANDVNTNNNVRSVVVSGP